MEKHTQIPQQMEHLENNRLRVGVVQTKTNLHKWGYNTETVDCDCGSKLTEHILISPLNSVMHT